MKDSNGEKNDETDYNWGTHNEYLIHVVTINPVGLQEYQ